VLFLFIYVDLRAFKNLLTTFKSLRYMFITYCAYSHSCCGSVCSITLLSQSLPFRGFGGRLRGKPLYTIQCDSKYNSGLSWLRSLSRLTCIYLLLLLVICVIYTLYISAYDHYNTSKSTSDDRGRNDIFTRCFANR
jgi:hypothetical protein